MRFGDSVAEIVSDCTDAWTEPKLEWRPRKEAYLAKLPAKPPQSLLVSLADKTHNAEAILFDYRILGDPSGSGSMAARRAHAGITVSDRLLRGCGGFLGLNCRELKTYAPRQERIVQDGACGHSSQCSSPSPNRIVAGAHGAYKFKRQRTGDVLAIDRIKETGKEVLIERGLGLLLFWSCCETCAGAQSEKPTGLRDQPVRSAAPRCDSSRRQLREAREADRPPSHSGLRAKCVSASRKVASQSVSPDLAFSTRCCNGCNTSAR